MNALQSKFEDFRVLGVPCNQFALVSDRIHGALYTNELESNYTYT